MVEKGWYPDPLGRAELRWWDGEAWSEHVSRGGEVSSDPIVEAKDEALSTKTEQPQSDAAEDQKPGPGSSEQSSSVAAEAEPSEEATAPGAGAVREVHYKPRKPLVVGLLSLFTLGGYFLYWYWQVNRELAELGRSRSDIGPGEDPSKSFIAMTIGGFIILPPLISAIFGLPGRITAAFETLDTEGRASRLVAFLSLLILGGFFYPLYIQSRLNRVWAAYATAPAAEPQIKMTTLAKASVLAVFAITAALLIFYTSGLGAGNYSGAY